MPLATGTADVLGMSNLRLLEFPHPLGGLEPAEVEGRAALVARKVLALFEIDE